MDKRNAHGPAEREDHVDLASSLRSRWGQWLTPRALRIPLIAALLAMATLGAGTALAQTITTIAGNGSSDPTGRVDGGAAVLVPVQHPGDVAVDAGGNVYVTEIANSRILKITPGGVLTTIAGSGTTPGFSGDGGLATQAKLNQPRGLALDAAGNIYFADMGNHRIRKVDTAGIISTIAGDGTNAFGGDNGPAINAQLNLPGDVAVGLAGDIFFTEFPSHRVRRVDALGVITTVAGNGIGAFAGDGGQATSASLFAPDQVLIAPNGFILISDAGNQRIRVVDNAGVIQTLAGSVFGFAGDGGGMGTAQFRNPSGLALDPIAGALYIGDASNFRIRKIQFDPNDEISTVVGTGAQGFSGDGGDATLAKISDARSVAVDAAGNLYIADNTNHRIRKVVMPQLSTAVGGGSAVGDGLQAAMARLHTPSSVTIDAGGNMYIADRFNNRVRKITPAGVISTVAGTGEAGFSGDGGPATDAKLNAPAAVAVDGAGNLFVSDADNDRIRKITPGGTISTFAGDGTRGYGGDGGPATAAKLNFPGGIAIDASGNVAIADVSNNRVRLVSTLGTITTVAGTGAPGFSGEGGLATAANVSGPFDVAFNGAGVLHIADSNNNRIRKVLGGNIITIAGNGSFGLAGDGLTATSAQLAYPTGIAFDASGNLFIADSNNSRVRKVDGGAVITTVAGQGSASGLGHGFGGDGGLATSAYADFVTDVAVDASGAFYFTDQNNNRVRRVSPTGTITTYAGGLALMGDGGPATDAIINTPYGPAFDSAGNLYVSDRANHRVRKIAVNGTITTIAGTGSNVGALGDGGPATSARLNYPRGLAVDGAGNVYIADADDNLVRKVTPGGVITTLAGTGTAGYNGDGILATTAQLNQPVYVAVASNGDVYFSDRRNHRVRKVTPGGIISTVAGTGVCNNTGNGGLAISAPVCQPWGLAFDSVGNLYIADNVSSDVRRVTPGGIISRVAGLGTGLATSSGDGGQAVNAGVDPFGLAVDSADNLYIAESFTGRVRKVRPDGVISTFAGNGSFLSSDYVLGGGDGGAAIYGHLGQMFGVAVNAANEVFVADTTADRVRVIKQPKPPTAPTAAAATPVVGPLDGRATVTFAAPASDGGHPIAGYVVVSSLAGGVDTNAGSTGLSHLVTGLTPGVNYTFSVLATSAAGTSVASTASNSVTAAASMSVNVTSMNFGTVAQGTASAKQVLILTNESASPITINNEVSAGGSSITPGDFGFYLPSCGTVIPAGDDCSIEVDFSPPAAASPGLVPGTLTIVTSAGNVVTPLSGTAAAYDATATPSPLTFPDTAIGSQSAVVTVTVTNNSVGTAGIDFVDFDSGDEDEFIVVSTNCNLTLASGASCDADVKFAPTTVGAKTTRLEFMHRQFDLAVTVNATALPRPPGVLTAPVASAGNAQASVTFAAGTDDGGSPITGYTVTSLPAGGVDAAAGSLSLSRTITGLTNGVSYTFTVQATNVAGTSAASPPSNAVTPVAYTVPTAPRNAVAVAANASATVTFLAPLSDGGTPITGYTVVSTPAGGVDSNAGSTSLSHAITGLSNGTAYTFRVIATNLAGNSPASAPSNAITPSAIPALSVSDASVVEGNSGTRTATFTISLSQVATAAIGFRIGTADGSATAGSDYVAREAVDLSIPAGQSSLAFQVTVNGDTAVEPDETLMVNITRVTNGKAVDAQGVATVVDDDSPTQPSLVARDDRVVLAENADPVAISVLANDSYSASRLVGGSLTITSAPLSGSASILGNGTASNAADDRVRYVPGADSSGEDVFGYRLCDGTGGCSEALVSVVVRPLADNALTLQVDTTAGYRDVSVTGLRSLPSARFDATPLVTPVSSEPALAVDPTPDTPWDASRAGTAFVLRTLPVIASGPPQSWQALVDATSGPAGNIDLYLGIDSNRDGLPSSNELDCVAAMSTVAERCELALTVNGDGVAVSYWVLAHNRAAAANTARLQVSEVPMIASDGSLVATGPGTLAADATFPLRLSWNDPGLLPGDTRIGYLRVRSDAATAIGSVPVRIDRVGAVVTAAALSAADGTQSLRLAAGAAHDRLFVDVPVGATSLTVSTLSAQNIDLYLARVASPSSPQIDPAPARSAASHSAVTASGNETITVSGAALLPGRWYVTPVNAGASAASLQLQTQLQGPQAVAGQRRPQAVSAQAAAEFRPGGYFNPARGGHGLFLYPAADQLAGLWFTYLQNGTPTWYYLQGPAPGADGIWTAPILRSVWNGSSNQLTAVGTATATVTGNDAFAFTYTLDGETGSEPFSSFGRGCPSLASQPLDVSSHWFNPARAGSGYSVQLFPNYEFYATFVYDGQGVARFLVAERGTFGSATETLDLQQLTGFCPLCTRTGAPTRASVGVFTRDFAGGTIGNLSLDAIFTGGVPGAWTGDEAVQLLGGPGTTQGCVVP